MIAEAVKRATHDAILRATKERSEQEAQFKNEIIANLNSLIESKLALREDQSNRASTINMPFAKPIAVDKYLTEKVKET